MSSIQKVALSALFAGSAMVASAQSIVSQPTPYQDNPVLPFQSAVQAQRIKPQSWRVELSDGSLSKALLRWSRLAGSPLLWEAPKDLPVVMAVYQGDFIAAIEQVMRDSANSSYPLHACVYDNVVRVLHVSQNCAR